MLLPHGRTLWRVENARLLRLQQPGRSGLPGNDARRIMATWIFKSEQAHMITEIPNPATGQVEHRQALMGANTVEAALHAAQAAFPMSWPPRP